ncbi:MAG: D-alanyl-D-alanine carboxypeptidase family protein [Eubacteriales bacterium]|nr:D-alanyl-D-alanine carboxypeptidase family protein [Eubacteriales bacterium]
MKTKRRLFLPVLISILLIAALSYGGWLWYDSHVDRSGWVEKDGIRFYQDFHADPVSGWLELDGGRYYFHDDGTPSLGWKHIGGIPYYFDENGIMVTGWQELDGQRYYFGYNGTMVENWLWLDEGIYFLRDGVMVTGWQDIEGQRYYFDENGIMALGFADLEGSRYYFGSDGAMVTGSADIDGQQYRFLEDGTMFTGWQDTDEGRCYYLPDGPMAFGWTEIEDCLYYFAEDGMMRTGWLQLGEYRYYLQEDGAASVGPTVIGGETHYFTPKGIEVVLVNALNPIPSYYEIELKNVVDYHDVDIRCYDALVQMLADCSAAGIEYVFNSAYRTMEEQTEILELRTLEHMKTYDLDFEEAREKALETVAIPGTSEHQMGLAVDLLGDEATAWLQEHCWEYGFILRYPLDKKAVTGIINEPWHYRYVGTEVSLDMKDSGLCLEEYLGADPVEG